MITLQTMHPAAVLTPHSMQVARVQIKGCELTCESYLHVYIQLGEAIEQGGLFTLVSKSTECMVSHSAMLL